MAGPISVEYLDLKDSRWHLAHQGTGQVKVTLGGVAVTLLLSEGGRAYITVNPDAAPGLDWTEVAATEIQGRLTVRGAAW